MDSDNLETTPSFTKIWPKESSKLILPLRPNVILVSELYLDVDTALVMLSLLRLALLGASQSLRTSQRELLTRIELRMVQLLRDGTTSTTRPLSALKPKRALFVAGSDGQWTHAVLFYAHCRLVVICPIPALFSNTQIHHGETVS